jgi:hypothetical protein
MDSDNGAGTGTALGVNEHRHDLPEIEGAKKHRAKAAYKRAQY